MSATWLEPGIRDGWNYYLARRLDTFPIYVKTSQPGHAWSLPYHRQPGVEINITHCGRAQLSVNRYGYLQSNRQVAAFSGTCTHSFSVDRQLPYRRTVICIEDTLFQALIRTRRVKVRPDVMDAIRHDYYGFSLNCEQWAVVESLTVDLARTFQERGPWWQQVVAAQSAELVASLFVGASDTVHSDTPSSAWLEQCRRYVEQNLDKELSLNEVASYFYVSPEHLTRAFRKAYGISFMRFVQRERIKFACKLLSEGERPVADIAEAAGFTSRTHFHRAFKKAMGVTPADYRDGSKL